MKVLVILLLAVSAYGEQLGNLLDAVPTDVLSDIVKKDAKMLKSNDEASPMKLEGFQKPPVKKMFVVQPVGVPMPGKSLKAAVVAPVKKAAFKKAVAGKILKVPKLKKAVALKSKPKVYSLKPIVHVIEKKVPVYHKVPVPKKVIVPKFYPVMKYIPVPKIIPVPYKVPVKKIIPKIVKIPKAIPIPKIVAVKKPIPIAIPYPVPKFHKFPIYKPVPYAKYIPVPVPKKVPKFIPFPVKKIIKIPKPYYVPIKVPHFTTSYVKMPTVVDVPDVKKMPSKGKFKILKPTMIPVSDGNKGEAKFLESILGTGKEGSMFDTLAGLGGEDKELLKLLAGSQSGEKSV